MAFVDTSQLKPVFQNSSKLSPLSMCGFYRLKAEQKGQAGNPECAVDLSMFPSSQQFVSKPLCCCRRLRQL